MSDYLQVAIAALIVCLVLFTFLKYGRENPETTGTLSRQIQSHRTQIAALETSLEECATRGAVNLLAEQVRNLEAHGATSGEVLALEAKINALSTTVTAQLATVAHSTERTERAIARIEGYFIERGVKGS
ncbi:hypothetical protein DBR17_17840 [Sphingomonas sp. HMWF008]|nr:hypothetical protein DBR17_17840 [Sphingomonas sp. HMWF008]